MTEMSDRIRQLEDGLEILQSSVTRDPHPLLAAHLLKIKSMLELHPAAELPDSDLFSRDSSLGAPQLPTEDGLSDDDAAPPLLDALGTLALRDDGAATFYGRSAGSEVRFLILLRGLC